MTFRAFYFLIDIPAPRVHNRNVARTARASVSGYFYQVLNRENQRARVFHTEVDYEVFVDLLAQARHRRPMRVLAYYGLMPNPFHLVLWPHGDGDLSRWMQGLVTTQVRRYAITAAAATSDRGGSRRSRSKRMATC